MRRLIALLALFASVSPAAACINGWDTPVEEQEFRSQYGTKPTPPPSVEPSYRPGNGLLIGVGAAGLVAAGALALAAGRMRV